MKPFIEHPHHLLTLAVALGLTQAAQAQLSWSSYDTSGTLINANAGTGGDGATTVNLAVPANSTVIFLTSNFSPINVASGTSSTVNYDLSASGGFTSASSRIFGVGLYNTGGTSTLADDTGFFGLFNAGGPYIESYAQTGNANLFSGTQQGEGYNNTGSFTDNTVYNSLIRLYNSGSGVALGTGSAFANAGVAFENSTAGVNQTAYINPVTGMPTSYNEFALEFDNTTASSVTLTLSNIGLTATPVPEPSVYALGLLGAAMMFGRFRRR